VFHQAGLRQLLNASQLPSRIILSNPSQLPCDTARLDLTGHPDESDQMKSGMSRLL